MTAYSNRLDLANTLVKAMQQLRRARQREHDAPASVPSAGRSDRQWRVNDQLSEQDVRTLVGPFAQGTPKWKLDERYGISESSMKRLVQKQR